MAEVVRFGTEAEERVKVDAAFAMVADIMEQPHDTSEDLVEVAGSPNFYSALIASSETFIREHPDILRGRAPAPEVVALWIGLLVGARAAQEV